ncbi:MAG: hypothetical protein Q8O55_08800 [Dehalococcoidales bacterium]|nr:hypothetical protein [Dehalococcoidales bacterium]
MPKRQKLYRLGVPIPVNEANKLLGLPADKKLSWQEFQEYAKRNSLSIKAENISD